MLKKSLSLLIALLLCFGLCACSKNKKDKEEFKPVDIETLQESMLGAAKSLPETNTISSNDEQAEEYFSAIVDLEYEKVYSYFITYATTAAADEIAVVCVKDENDVPAVLKSLENHANERVELFRPLADEEEAKMENALVFAEGNYAVMIICDNAKQVKEAFITEANINSFNK